MQTTGHGVQRGECNWTFILIQIKCNPASVSVCARERETQSDIFIIYDLPPGGNSHLKDVLRSRRRWSPQHESRVPFPRSITSKRGARRVEGKIPTNRRKISDLSLDPPTLQSWVAKWDAVTGRHRQGGTRGLFMGKLYKIHIKRFPHISRHVESWAVRLWEGRGRRVQLMKMKSRCWAMIAKWWCVTNEIRTRDWTQSIHFRWDRDLGIGTSDGRVKTRTQHPMPTWQL